MILKRIMKHRLALFTALLLVPPAALRADDMPIPEKTDVFTSGLNGISRYHIPGIVETTKNTLLAYCEARINSSSD